MSYLARFYVGSGPNTLPSDFQARTETAVGVLEFLGIDGATILPAVGVWKGKREESLVVELVVSSPHEPALRTIAGELRARFSQDSVLVTVAPVTSFLAEKAP